MFARVLNTVDFKKDVSFLSDKIRQFSKNRFAGFSLSLASK